MQHFVFQCLWQHCILHWPHVQHVKFFFFYVDLPPFLGGKRVLPTLLRPRTLSLTGKIAVHTPCTIAAQSAQVCPAKISCRQVVGTNSAPGANKLTAQRTLEALAQVDLHLSTLQDTPAFQTTFACISYPVLFAQPDVDTARDARLCGR